ncbi:Imm53 family immunity protein [Kribbella sp. NBC_01245]|uniref:Imm53 family immunity protein n=1 Tax=Kribbella sp. NBC_01245 TaxID=2903578 RepID=UPI003FA530C2
MTTTALLFLIDWFAAHCDGDWEHDLGIRIAPLDNPGWSLDVSTADTELKGRVIDWVRIDDDENGWLHWRSTGIAFEARCGPVDLQRALDAFRSFATGDGGE